MKTQFNPPSRFGSESIAPSVHLARYGCSRVALLLAVLVLAAQPTHAAVTEAWAQRYDGPAKGLDAATAVAIDGSGNVVVTGYSYNGDGTDFDWGYYTAKYAAADGALLWEHRYNGPADSDDRASAVAVDGNGNVVVTGSTTGLGGSGYDYYTAKYAATDGALLWERRYDASVNNDDEAYAVALDGSGNVVVTGYSLNPNIVGEPDDGDYYTAKYAAADGALLWEKRYHGLLAGGFDFATAVAVDASGNVVVTGTSGTVKYAAADGALLWKTRNNVDEDDYNQATALALDNVGNAVVTGWIAGYGYDVYTAKYAAADGALLWKKCHTRSGDSFDEAHAVAVDGSGNVVVTGTATIKYLADGTGVWTNNTGGNCIAVDGSGNVVVTAQYYDTAKYAAANGALLWEQHFSPNTLGSHCLALGPNGMVVVTGWITDGSNSTDYATVVYRENLPAVSVALVPAGVRLRFPGVAGHSYQVLRAPTVIGPWSTNATLSTLTTGLLEYLDTNAPLDSAFYRTAVAP